MDKKEVKEKFEELLKTKAKKGNFKQTIEMAVNFKGVDLAGKDKLNLTVTLPKGRGKDIEVGVFGDGDLNLNAKKHSKHVLSKNELETMAKDKRAMKKFATACYWTLAQPDLMATIGKTWGVVLGTRGKMPQPIPPKGDPIPVITRFKNSIRIKSKKSMVVHAPIGVEDMSVDDLIDNFFSVLTAIERQIPQEKVASIYIKKTMGDAIRAV